MEARAGEVRAGRGRSQDKGAAEAQAGAWRHRPSPGGRVSCRAPELAHRPGTAPLAASKAASKFKTRCAQFGFEDVAQLDDGTLWPTVYAITDNTEAGAPPSARG